MALVLKYQWPQTMGDPVTDTWRDERARATCDAAARSCETNWNDYWGVENVEFDKQSSQSSAGRNARLAEKPAGALVQDEAER